MMSRWEKMKVVPQPQEKTPQKEKPEEEHEQEDIVIPTGIQNQQSIIQFDVSALNNSKFVNQKKTSFIAGIPRGS